jgi:site-specific recombinase XerD
MNNVSGRLEKEQIFYSNMDKKLKDLPRIFTEYYTSMRANRKSYTTIGVYINNVLHLTNFLYDDKIEEDFYKKITSSDIEKYMISLETRVTSDGIKRTGDDILQSRWSSLNTFFGWLIKRNYITKNPMDLIDRPKNNTEHKVTYLDKKEIAKLIKAASNNKHRVLAVRDTAIIHLALATALRIGALTNINIEDIDFENGVINVIEKRQKTRAVSIGENTQKILKEWIEVRNEAFPNAKTTALFLSQVNKRISDDAINIFLENYCKEAGIKRITPHKLRASSACALAKAGVPVKAIAKQLNHSGIAVTMRYVDVFNEDMEKSKNILDNLT